MSKHTNGPWVAVRTVAPKGWNIEALDGAYTVAIARDGTGLPQNEANARLIASAPELVIELRQAIIQMEMAAECIENGRCDEALLHVSSLMRSKKEVLAKATGESA